MKKLLIFILILVLLVTFVGCGVYTPPIIPTDPDEDDGKKPGGGTTPTDPDDGEMVFTVTLYSEGKRFSPNTVFYAQWTSEDKTEIVSAPFNALGVAQTKGLDGEYRVTLSGLPDDYTYNPNGNYVDNDNRNAIVELLPIIPTTNRGTNYYTDCIKVDKLGTYRHTFNGRDEKAWFRYEPTAQGKYVIESWVDVTENEINPIMVHYVGNSQYVNIDYPAGTYDGGGSASTYSKNFRFELQLNSGMVGNVWAFQLYAECKGEYPVNVDFTIRLIGDYSGTEETFEEILPSGPFLRYTPDGTWRYNYRDSNKVLDSSRFKLNESDGFYHLYDEVTYAANGGWGPVLLAKINKDNEIMDTEGLGFTHPLVSLKFNGKNYNTFIKAYVAFCNNDGVHPVTQELKEFLQSYAIFQSLFSDGESNAEVFFGLTAAEEDMWLFACGYYV